MKTLEDWLASSESSSSSSSSSESSASQPLVQKMEKVKISLDNVKHTPEEKVTPANLLAYLQQSSATISKAEKQSMVNAPGIDQIEKQMNSFLTPIDDTKYERVEVMVVDRGTQTVTTTSTQTDEPYFISHCPQCNHTACVTSANAYIPVATTLLHNRLQRGVDYVNGQYPTGIDGRPYRQLFDRFAEEQHKEASELLHQLEVIQNSVDMLISRYNLPPPPPQPSSLQEHSTANNAAPKQELYNNCIKNGHFANMKTNSSDNTNREQFSTEPSIQLSRK